MDFDRIELVWNEEGNCLVGRLFKSDACIAEKKLNQLMSEAIAEQVVSLLEG